jgi:hypothetical protein
MKGDHLMLKHVCGLLAALTLGLVVQGCAEPIPVKHDALDKDYITRVRLQNNGQKIYSSNYTGGIHGYPPGSRAQITMFSTIRVDLKINNIPHQMFPVGGDFNAGAIDEFVRKYFVETPAELGLDENLEPLGPDESVDDGADDKPTEAEALDFRFGLMDRGDRTSIAAGSASIGMTKAQVYMALGPPPEINFGQSTLGMPMDTILDANQWVYYSNWITPWWFQRVYKFDGTTLIAVEQ